MVAVIIWCLVWCLGSASSFAWKGTTARVAQVIQGIIGGLFFIDQVVKNIIPKDIWIFIFIVEICFFLFIVGWKGEPGVDYKNVYGEGDDDLS